MVTNPIENDTNIKRQFSTKVANKNSVAVNLYLVRFVSNSVKATTIVCPDYFVVSLREKLLENRFKNLYKIDL